MSNSPFTNGTSLIDLGNIPQYRGMHSPLLCSVISAKRVIQHLCVFDKDSTGHRSCSLYSLENSIDLGLRLEQVLFAERSPKERRSFIVRCDYLPSSLINIM